MPTRSPRRDAYPWYDSLWLSQYAAAKAIVEQVRPEALKAFVDAFGVLRTPPRFREHVLDAVFDENTMQEVGRVVRALRPGAPLAP